MGPVGPCLRQSINPPPFALPTAMALIFFLSTGCAHHPMRVAATVGGDVGANVQASIQGPINVQLPGATDPGPMVPTVVKQSSSGPNSARVALIDIDGLLLNQNLAGPYASGENPVASFREKLEAAACDPRVRAVVIRINSPGGGVAATDMMAEELRRFRDQTRKPVVACLLDTGTSSAATTSPSAATESSRASDDRHRRHRCGS